MRHRASSEGSDCFAEHDLVVDAQPAEAIQRGKKKRGGTACFKHVGGFIARVDTVAEETLRAAPLHARSGAGCRQAATQPR